MNINIFMPDSNRNFGSAGEQERKKISTSVGVRIEVLGGVGLRAGHCGL